MKITFIQPPALMAVDNYSTITQPPLGIAYLAAYVREKGHKVHAVDAVGEAVNLLRPWTKHKNRLIQGLSFEEICARIPRDTQVIAFSCMFTHAWPFVRELIHLVHDRFPNARLIAGGEHITSMYETVLAASPVEVCILGEGEITLSELLAALEASSNPDLASINGLAYKNTQGETICTPRRARIAVPDELPLPAWDILDPEAYMGSIAMGPTAGRMMPMLATRGCPFECTFCSSPNMWTQNWKPRDPVKVIDEIEFYMKKYRANDFQFQDLTAIVRKDWIIRFSKEIIRRKLNITWQLPVGTRSEAIDQEVAEHLKASGCHHITYAPESGSETILKSIKKMVNLKHLESSAQASLNAGLYVCLFMIVGFPQETKEDIHATFRWLRHMAKIGVHEIAVSTFVPLPGTELYREMIEAKPFPIDDEYCHWMTGATSLFTVRSWHPAISSRKLLFLKLSALFQFYALSYFYHPGRLLRVFKNLFLHIQETKVDRVLQEFVQKIRLFMRALGKPRSQNSHVK